LLGMEIWVKSSLLFIHQFSVKKQKKSMDYDFFHWKVWDGRSKSC
jgi:hypothetical protein